MHFGSLNWASLRYPTLDQMPSNISYLFFHGLIQVINFPTMEPWQLSYCPSQSWRIPLRLQSLCAMALEHRVIVLLLLVPGNNYTKNYLNLRWAPHNHSSPRYSTRPETVYQPHVLSEHGKHGGVPYIRYTSTRWPFYDAVFIEEERLIGIQVSSLLLITWAETDLNCWQTDNDKYKITSMDVICRGWPSIVIIVTRSEVPESVREITSAPPSKRQHLWASWFKFHVYLIQRM